MKNILLLCFVFLASCKISKNTVIELSEHIILTTENCPENGECSIQFIPKKTIDFKKDEFGIAYPVISEGNKSIFKFTYKRKPLVNTQDSNYTEIVYAEIDNTISDISLIGNELKTVKLYFGRLCYCKGETGYFPIKNGSFNIKKSNNNSLKVDIEFTIKEVPQIISKITETVSLKSNATN